MTVPNVCGAAGCENVAPLGPLCSVCEGKWMRDRRDVVETAEHLTDLAARFSAWCREHGHPDPFKD